jgi:multiple sugar transport system substrate-binding protein
MAASPGCGSSDERATTRSEVEVPAPAPVRAQDRDTVTLRVALVGGPMYDHLYTAFAPGEVEVVVHADHPTLNRRVAELLAAGERLDVIATHGKYAPSQTQWLRPLDELIAPEAVAALAPRAVDLCRVDGTSWCLPRLIDVRVLWARASQPDDAVDTWEALAGSDVVVGFPGRESGLFGTFFELVVGSGGRLFDDDGRPDIATDHAEWAIALLCRLAARAPQDLPEWHYDEVDAALLAGRVEVAGAWPGAWDQIRPLAEAGALVPHRYPSGAVHRVTYSGCHAWAIPRSCGDLPGAVALVERLLAADAQTRDARGGSVCAHVDAFAAVVPESAVDRRRLAITREMIDTAMITYPPLARFPEVEDAGWVAIKAALQGRLSPAEAAQAIQAAAAAVL